MNTTILFESMKSRLDDASLELLCFYLAENQLPDLEIGGLTGNGVSGKWSSLISYCRRRLALTALIDNLNKVRPDSLAADYPAWHIWAVEMDSRTQPTRFFNDSALPPPLSPSENQTWPAANLVPTPDDGAQLSHPTPLPASTPSDPIPTPDPVLPATNAPALQIADNRGERAGDAVLVAEMSALMSAAIESSDWDEAISIGRSIFVLDPGNEVACHGLAVAYRTRAVSGLDRSSSPYALDDFNQAIELEPNEASTYNGRGLLRSGLGQYPLAIQDFSQAIALDGNYATAWLNRAKAYAATGKRSAARADLEAAARLGNAEARDSLDS